MLANENATYLKKKVMHVYRLNSIDARKVFWICLGIFSYVFFFFL